VAMPKRTISHWDPEGTGLWEAGNEDADDATRTNWSRAMAGAPIGFAGAIGALGGVGINLAWRQSYLSIGSATSAFWMFASFLVIATGVTWLMYVRRPAGDSSATRTAQPEPANLAPA